MGREVCVVPELQVQDKVAFIMNNLSIDNLSSKAEELKKVLTSDHWNWFVNYLVVRRAAQVRVLLAYIDAACMLWHTLITRAGCIMTRYTLPAFCCLPPRSLVTCRRR